MRSLRVGNKIIFIAGGIGTAVLSAVIFFHDSAVAKQIAAGKKAKAVIVQQTRTGSPIVSHSNLAPENIIDHGDCPYEGCRYGERWLAKQDVDVYFSPPNAFGVPITSLQKKAVVHKGDWVRTESGIVLSTRGEGRVDLKDHNHTEWGNDIANGSPSIANNPPLKDGEVISVYGSGSEGCYRTFFAGEPFIICNVQLQREPQYEWWIQIKTADGYEAWANSAGQSFVSEDGLNDELARKIADTELPLTGKLAQVDAFLKIGGDINGSGGQYGTGPIEAAISTNDIDILKALMSKGLNIRNRQPCTAYIAAQNALKPGGDLMLEFLLQSGMPLDCLHQPPIHEFLTLGIATDNYPVEQAIRVVEIIDRNGVMRINERNSQGQTIFDVLDRLPAKATAHILPLREALTKMMGPH